MSASSILTSETKVLFPQKTEKYTIATDAWDELEDLPEKIVYGSMVYFNEKLVVYGGFDNENLDKRFDKVIQVSAQYCIAPKRRMLNTQGILICNRRKLEHLRKLFSSCRRS